MVTELLTPANEWVTLSTDSPFGDFYPAHLCSVPLNSTHLFFSGGDFYGGVLADTWTLDLENLEWTSSAPMLTGRSGHGCVLTADGEVLVAGGYPAEDAVHIYNPVSLGKTLIEKKVDFYLHFLKGRWSTGPSVTFYLQQSTSSV